MSTSGGLAGGGDAGAPEGTPLPGPLMVHAEPRRVSDAGDGADGLSAEMCSILRSRWDHDDGQHLAAAKRVIQLQQHLRPALPRHLRYDGQQLEFTQPWEDPVNARSLRRRSVSLPVRAIVALPSSRPGLPPSVLPVAPFSGQPAAPPPSARPPVLRRPPLPVNASPAVQISTEPRYSACSPQRARPRPACALEAPSSALPLAVSWTRELPRAEASCGRTWARGEALGYIRCLAGKPTQRRIPVSTHITASLLAAAGLQLLPVATGLPDERSQLLRVRSLEKRGRRVSRAPGCTAA
ncbi:hypothetical protein T492DRAFT_267456 [Pavlovales sp. CCMP2436]|nr:hypothetical protein T492DRAFT_267456 [Pavlovales sp. CCMP2436]